VTEYDGNDGTFDQVEKDMGQVKAASNKKQEQ